MMLEQLDSLIFLSYFFTAVLASHTDFFVNRFFWSAGDSLSTLTVIVNECESQVAENERKKLCVCMM